MPPNKTKSRKPRSKGKKPGKSIKNYVKNAIDNQKELKYNCVQVNSTAMDGTWVTLLDRTQEIAQGDNVDNRDGNTIKQLGIHARVSFALAKDRPQSLRLIALEKRNTYTVATDLPQDGTGRELIGCFTPEGKGKFRVLYDKVFDFANASSYVGSQTGYENSLFRHVHEDIYLKLPKRLKFDGPLSSDLEAGKVSWYAATDNLAAGTDFIDVAMELITYYKDI